MDKLDKTLVSTLAAEGNALAVVRVRTAWQLDRIERHFEVLARFPFINSVGLRCDGREATRLAAMQEVVSVTAQSRVRALDAGGNGLPTGAECFSAPGADRLTGRGVRLCVMDTGVSPHTDVSVPRDRIVEFHDMVAGGEFPYDDNGHGTFVTGVAAGGGVLSGGRVLGVAPRAEIVAVKVIGSSGETGAFTILEGMQWLFDNFRRLNVKVVCMSFGAEPLASADPLKLGAEMLSRSGITVVCASGNSGVGHLKSPGISGEVITVGAVDEDSKVAEFSSSGVYQGVYRPDVCAPGVAVKGLDAGGTYALMSGTSVSAPYVAGACCLLHEKYRALSPREAKRMIIASARVTDGVRVFRL